MNSKITYHQQVSYCGKPRCRRCREGIGHGPYWYAYQTIDGRTVRTYVGKEPPAEMQSTAQEAASAEGTAAAAELPSRLVRLHVLGQFRLEHRNGQHWQTVKDAAMQHQRVRSLLSCLISTPGRKLGREQMMDMLWPDADFETAAHRLDRAVHSLRQLLEPGRSRPATSSLLLTEYQTIQLANQEQLWTDADAFDALVAQARASNDPGQTEQLLEEAMLLYCGDFLPDERNTDWIQTRREGLRRSWIGLLLELADLRIARDALSSATDILDRLLSVDPTNEAALQRLIVLLARSGRRGEAIRAYQRFADVLKEEYNIAPLHETRSLFEIVQRGEDPTIYPQTQTNERRQLKEYAYQVDKGNTSPGQPGDHGEQTVVQVGRSHQSPLVGREQELKTLHQVLRTTGQATRIKLAGQKKTSGAVPISLEAQRSAQCVLLMGDVGIGKTRLAEETGREAKRRGWAVAWSRAYSQESSVPYHLWIEILRKAMVQSVWQRQEITRRPLIYQSLSTLLPELHDLLPQTELLAITPPEQEQIRLWEAMRSLLTLISESTPLLIVLDDLQWADGSSCELLSYLVRQLRGYPIMIVGTCRDIELPADHPLRSVLIDLQREQAVELLAIQPLSNEQIRTLLSFLPESLAQDISTRAAGNPFFAEELARSFKIHLTASPAIEAGNVMSQSPASNAVSELPDTISAVLDLRMGRISDACQRLLTRAAVLGGSFEFHLILAMEMNGAADEDAVLDLLEEALQAGMLIEEGSGTRITYHFWHPMLVSHLYEGLSAGRRARLHRKAAEVLQQRYAERAEEGAANIVYHLVNGGAEPSQVAHYAELAGDRAYALSAYPEAERHYRLAIEHLGEVSESASSDERLRLANLLERLGECTMNRGNFEEARHFYERVLEVRSQQQIHPSQAEHQQEAQLQALFWEEIGWTWYNNGDNAQARQCLEHGEQLLQEAGILAGTAWASLRYQYSSICWQEGSYDEALRAAYEALKLFEEAHSQQQSTNTAPLSTRVQRTLQGDPVDLGRIHRLLAAIEATVGKTAEAITHLHTALAIFEQFDHKRDITISCCNLGDAHLRRAEYSLAQAALRRSLHLAEQIGDIPHISIVFSNLGELAARIGNLTEAEDWFKKSLELAERFNDQVYMSWWNAKLALVLQELGKLPEAFACIRKALLIARSIHNPACIGLALVALSNIRIIQTMTAGGKESSAYSTMKLNASPRSTHFIVNARKCLQKALDLEGLEADTRIEGQLVLAQALLLQGELEPARQQSNSALEHAASYELTWLLARSQRMLGSILALQGQQKQSAIYFEQAINTFEKCGMRLEWARTLLSSGEALIQYGEATEASYQQGLHHLQEAIQVFHDCGAKYDLLIAEDILSRYTRAASSLTRKSARRRS